MNTFLIAALYGLAIMLAMGFITWLYSLYRKNVNIVDSLWSLMFLAGAVCYAAMASHFSAASLLLLILVAVWAVRLSLFLAVRNRGEEEDRRYREIRANNEPHFGFKSLYIIFGLQAVLAWIISIPLLMALSIDSGIGYLELAALAIWVVGFVFEATADLQLYRFKSNPQNKGKVLDTGLWAYSRHPNYFGEFLIWWAYFLFALSAGAWWTVFSPLLMTLLLLKVSGVSLMEKGITERRANYREYIESTNAFFPGRPRRSNVYIERGQES
jgi:steroid 5-alpha reductase family enzyme